jgi:hypothetical protein
VTPQDVAREVRRLEEELAKAIIGQVKKVWPDNVNGVYTVTHRNGKVRVVFNPPPQKESGWRDE